MAHICAEESGWLIQMHVKPDSRVGFGDALYDIADESGIVSTVKSSEFGIVTPFENGKNFPTNEDLKAGPIFIKRGTGLFVIGPYKEGRVNGGDAGLRPRPTRVIFNRRLRAAQLHA